jgi:hypothetical protein
MLFGLNMTKTMGSEEGAMQDYRRWMADFLAALRVVVGVTHY